MQLKRIITSVFLVICMCLAFCFPVYAEAATAYSSAESISPLYDIANHVMSELAVIGTKADCKSYASGNNVAKITVEQTLQKYSGWFWIWNTVDGASWLKTVNGLSVNLSNTKSGLSSGTYRLQSVFTLTDKNGKSETITVYSEEKVIG